jgi:hypothetical protein
MIGPDAPGQWREDAFREHHAHDFGGFRLRGRGADDGQRCSPRARVVERPDESPGHALGKLLGHPVEDACDEGVGVDRQPHRLHEQLLLGAEVVRHQAGIHASS